MNQLDIQKRERREKILHYEQEISELTKELNEVKGQKNSLQTQLNKMNTFSDPSGLTIEQI